MNNETETVGAAPVAPLSVDEESAWTLMVEEGRKIRAPIRERQEAQLAGQPEWVRKMKGKKRDALGVIPIPVKRWVILRMAGVSFKKASTMSGATWLQVQDARARSEEFRCALAAQEENSRQLMRAKAESIVEQSQDEDAKVSIAQTNVSLKILECLDRSHFGVDERAFGKAAAEEVAKQLGGGGFVINLIGDAAKVAEAAPTQRPAKAVVYTDV